MSPWIVAPGAPAPFGIPASARPAVGPAALLQAARLREDVEDGAVPGRTAARRIDGTGDRMPARHAGDGCAPAPGDPIGAGRLPGAGAGAGRRAAWWRG